MKFKVYSVSLAALIVTFFLVAVSTGFAGAQGNSCKAYSDFVCRLCGPSSASCQATLKKLSMMAEEDKNICARQLSYMKSWSRAKAKKVLCR